MILVIIYIYAPELGPAASAALGAGGEAAAQTVEINGGQRQGYNYGAIAVAGLSAGSGGASAGPTSSVILNAAIQAVSIYVVSYAVNRALGQEDHFQWKGVATAAVSAAISAAIFNSGGTGQDVADSASNAATQSGFSWATVAKQAASAFAQSVARQAIGYGVEKAITGHAHWNWEQVTDTALQSAGVAGLTVVAQAALQAYRSQQAQQQQSASPAGAGNLFVTNSANSYGNFGMSLFGNGSGPDPFSTQAFGVSAAPTSAFAGANPFGDTVNPSLGLFGGFGDWGSAGASASQTAPQTISYTVRPGDTPDTIAEKQLGSRYLFGEVMAAAGITDPRKLQVGATLELTDPASMDQDKLAMSMQDAAKYYGYTDQSQSFARLSQAYTQQAAQDRMTAVVDTAEGFIGTAENLYAGVTGKIDAVEGAALQYVSDSFHPLLSG